MQDKIIMSNDLEDNAYISIVKYRYGIEDITFYRNISWDYFRDLQLPEYTYKHMINRHSPVYYFEPGDQYTLSTDGFCFPEHHPYPIFVNKNLNHSDKERVLLHEFVHVGLNTHSIISNPLNVLRKLTNNEILDQWCYRCNALEELKACYFSNYNENIKVMYKNFKEIKFNPIHGIIELLSREYHFAYR